MRLIVVAALLGFLSACGYGESDPPGPQAGTGVAAPDGSPRPSAHGSRDPHQALSPAEHIKVALQHRKAGRMRLAIETLSRALVRFGADKQLLAVRSSLYLETDNLSAALQDINSALKLDSTDPRLLINRAGLYQKFGRQEEGLADLDKAIAIDGNLLAAYFNRGTVHYQNGEYHQALADFTRCIEIDASVAGPYFNRAAVREVLGQRGAAVADIERFMALTDNKTWKRKAAELLNRWGQSSNIRPGTATDARNSS